MSAESYRKHSRFPSVTNILAPYSGVDKIPPWHLAKAAERGTTVHSYCAAMALNEWTPPPPQAYRGYVESARQWLDAFLDEALLVEVELEDESLGFCGHPDLVIRSRKLGGIILTDYKTPATLHRKIWGSQLAAYEKLIAASKGIVIDRMGSLRLDAKGKMAKFDEFTDNRVSYWSAFYGALIANRFFL